MSNSRQIERYKTDCITIVRQHSRMVLEWSNQNADWLGGRSIDCRQLSSCLAMILFRNLVITDKQDAEQQDHGSAVPMPKFFCSKSSYLFSRVVVVITSDSNFTQLEPPAINKQMEI
jgi:hypothetical protein